MDHDFFIPTAIAAHRYSWPRMVKCQVYIHDLHTSVPTTTSNKILPKYLCTYYVNTYDNYVAVNIKKC